MNQQGKDNEHYTCALNSLAKIRVGFSVEVLNRCIVIREHMVDGHGANWRLPHTYYMSQNGIEKVVAAAKDLDHGYGISLDQMKHLAGYQEFAERTDQERLSE